MPLVVNPSLERKKLQKAHGVSLIGWLAWQWLRGRCSVHRHRLHRAGLELEQAPERRPAANAMMPAWPEPGTPEEAAAEAAFQAMVSGAASVTEVGGGVFAKPPVEPPAAAEGEPEPDQARQEEQEQEERREERQAAQAQLEHGRLAMEAVAGALREEQLRSLREEQQAAAEAAALMKGGGPIDRRPTAASSIHVAVQSGDATALAQHLRDGVPVDARNPRENTPLMLAAANWHAALVATLLAAGADPLKVNNRRLTSRELAARHAPTGWSAGKKQLGPGAEIDAMLLEAEQRAADPAAAGGEAAASEQRQKLCCPVCGEALKRKNRIDYLNDDGQSRYVSDFLRSDGLHTMRTHPQYHYHSLLNTRQLRKEVSESWAVIAGVRELLVELQLDPHSVVLFDLCSGKGLTAVCMSLEWPEAKVVAVDIISDKCLPHTTDLTNLRYAEADLFTCAPMLQSEMRRSGADGQDEQLVGVLVGSHLCGRLSVQAVELFRTLPEVQALVLSPCCWPRKRDYTRPPGTGKKMSAEDVKLREETETADLAELAELMWLKATQSDTYTTWGRHLWRLLAAPSAALDSETAGVAVGIARDTEVLSEKNLVLRALRKQPVNAVGALQQHALGAQQRYIRSAGTGLWWRNAALREVYGQAPPPPESGERPRPRLEGNTKQLRKAMGKRPQSKDKSRQKRDAIMLDLVGGLGDISLGTERRDTRTRTLTPRDDGAA